MTVQQCNCYETATLMSQETNKAELRESDKQEYTAEDLSDNSLLLIFYCPVLSRKNPPNW